MVFTEASNWSLPAPSHCSRKDPPSLLPWGWSCHSSRMICHMVLTSESKWACAFCVRCWNLLENQKASFPLSSWDLPSAAWKRNGDFFFNHLLIVKCESTGVFEKAGLGAGFRGVHKTRPEQAHLAGKKGDCRLNGGKGLGSIIMEITYSRACFFSSWPHVSFHIGTAHRQASFWGKQSLFQKGSRGRCLNKHQPLWVLGISGERIVQVRQEGNRQGSQKGLMDGEAGRAF